MDSKNMKQCLTNPFEQSRHTNQKSLIGECGDLQKSSDKLMFQLVSIKFPYAYDEAQ